MVPLLQRSAGWLPRQTEEQRAEHYRRQGSLFERVSEEALKTAGWLAYRTGWSSEDAERLPSVVASVASTLEELEHSNWVRNVSPRANEAGLDLVFFRPFPDGRCGFPIYLAQCASGADWDTKLHTPVLAVWSKMIDFAAPPSKAFILPHSLGAEKLRRVTVKVQGIVLDRYRLHGSLPLDWCGAKLVKELRAFLEPLIAALPSYD
jgi:hypothetical protein